MLTIKSNLSIFKGRQGSYYTADDLTRLHKNLILTDVVNFKGGISYGYTDTIAEKIIAKLTINKNGKIIIVNDLSLHMLNKLLKAGYKLENIYLAYGKWNKDATPKDDKIVYNIMNAFIKANFEGNLNTITLEEMLNMQIKIDGIIANPPYGAIGANITDTIRQKVDYDQFVNLLPANDYKRNKTKDLFNYQYDMEVIIGGFEDAAVTTHLAKISKAKCNNLSLDDFEINNYNGKNYLIKYFKQQILKKHIAIDNPIRDTETNIKNIWNVATTFILCKRDPSAGHLPYTKNNLPYKWNVLKNINDPMLFWVNGGGSHYSINFKTELEKTNFVNFIYSDAGFKFMSAVFMAMHKDSWVSSKYWAPKVDWTRSWTVEEILRDYNYTEEEIAEVMADLDNFRGMDS